MRATSLFSDVGARSAKPIALRAEVEVHAAGEPRTDDFRTQRGRRIRYRGAWQNAQPADEFRPRRKAVANGLVTAQRMRLNDIDVDDQIAFFESILARDTHRSTRYGVE